MNKQPKTILVDQDGVLANYTKAHLEAIRRRYPELPHIRVEDAIHFGTEDLFPLAYREGIEALTLEKGFFLNLEPIPGALDALREMLHAGHDVRICTAPKKDYRFCVPEKFDWVREYLGQEWVERIVITRDKTLVHGDFLIDDKPKIEGARTPVWEHILYDQPYNRDINQTRLTWGEHMKVLGL